MKSPNFIYQGAGAAAPYAHTAISMILRILRSCWILRGKGSARRRYAMASDEHAMCVVGCTTERSC